MALTYDADGNTQTQSDASGPRTFRYDARDRLMTLEQPNAPPLGFDYQSDGLRIAKRQASQETRYQYDQQSLLAETNSIGNSLARYHYSATQLISRTEPGSTPTQRHYLLDSLATPIALLTQQGSVSARTKYDAWGEIVTQQNSSGTVTNSDTDGATADLTRTDAQPIGYTGYLTDQESGLYYAKARYYDPRIARFTTEDPEEGHSMQPPSLHRYLYAYANPTVYVDPTGRVSVLSDAEEITKESVKSYSDRIKTLGREDSLLTAAGVGLGYGLASVGDLVATGLNATSNLLARNYEERSSARTQAEMELAQSEQSMSQIIEGGANAYHTIKEDPAGTGARVATKVGEFSVELLSADRKAVAQTSAFIGTLLTPGTVVKNVRRIGEGLDAIRVASSFERAALADVGADLESAYAVAGRRAGIDIAHSPEIRVPFGTGIGNQGFAYENALASRLPTSSRLPANFKTFDFFDLAIGDAISVKTLDATTLARIADPRRIYSPLRRSVDAAADFNGYALDRKELLPEQIDLRAVRVAVPLETTAAQWEQIKRAIDYAKEQGVRLEPEVVRNSSKGK